MKKLLAIAGACVLLVSCGVEELESGTRFISKTQAGEVNNLNAFLIKKVTKRDHPTLNVHVNVGTWEGEGEGEGGVWKVHKGEGTRKPSVCVTHPDAVVRGAIAQWLTPLREAYGDSAIISDSNITFTDSTPALIVNFVCDESKPATSSWGNLGNDPACPTATPTTTPTTPTTTGYVIGKSCTTFSSANATISIGDFDEFRYAGPNDPKVHNAAFAGFGSPPSPGRDKIAGDRKKSFVLAYPPPEGEDGSETENGGGTPGEEVTVLNGNHDMLDLLHELGHAFGLADTHRAGVFGYPKHRQPLSIMSGNRTPPRGGPRLQLGYDDKRGIRWLYKYKNEDGNSDCPDNYTQEGTGCVPKDTLLYALLIDDYEHALELLKYAQRNPTENSININDKDTAAHGNTALHLAVFRFSGRAPEEAATSPAGSRGEDRKRAYLEIIRLILDDPAIKPNTPREDGDTALHLAVRLAGEDYRAVELLLTLSGIEPETPDARGDTVLHLAARMGDNELVKILQPTFRTTASVQNGRDKDDNTALHIAILGGHGEVTETLLNRISVSTADLDNKHGRTPLHLAAQQPADYGEDDYDATDVVRLLLEKGVTVNAKDNDDNTALHLAAMTGTLDTVVLLLNHATIDVTAENKRGHTPRDVAFHSNRPEEEKRGFLAAFDGTYHGEGTTEQNLLLMIRTDDLPSARNIIRGSKPGTASELNINYPEPRTLDTALHVATRYSAGNGGHVDVDFIGLLLRQPSIDPNLKNKDGETPLHLAAKRASPDVMQLLLNDNKIKVNEQICLTTACEGDTALHIAIRKRRGAEADTIIEHLLNHRDINVNLLAGVGVEVAPLHVAVDEGKDEIVEQLLASTINRVDVNLKTSYGATALHMAVEKKNMVITEHLIGNRNINPNLTDMHGDTPLHIAVNTKKDSTALVQELLTATNINVNVQDEAGNTALHLAAKNGNENIVGALLEDPDIDVTIENDRGDTALTLARAHQDIFKKIAESPRAQESLHGSWVKRLCTSGIKEKDDAAPQEQTQQEEEQEEPPPPKTPTSALGQLRAENPDINQKHNGATALHCAIERYGYSDGGLVEELLTRPELRVNETNSDGDTALHLAVVKGDRKAVEELLRRGDIRPNLPADKENVLLRALKARGGDTAIIALLLRYDNLNVNAKDSGGNTALHLSVTGGHSSLLATLLAIDRINVNAKNGHGNTPLHEAARATYTDTIRKLLAHPNIRPNERNNGGNTPLLAAVRAENQAVAQQLIGHRGVDVNAADRAGDTALHIALTKKNSEIFAMLMADGNIKVNSRGSSKKTPLLITINHNDVASTKALLGHAQIDPNLEETETREQNTPLHVAIKRHISTGESHIRIILALLSHSVIRPNIKNALQESALMIAVKHENNTLVSNLLQYVTVDVNTADSRDKTALMYSVERGSHAIPYRLVARGARVNLQDSKKFTALHYAAHYGRVQLASMLLQVSGIDITLTDKWGLTARERAALRGHDAVVALFESRRVEQERSACAVSILPELARGDSEDSLMAIIERCNIKVNTLDTNNRNYTALHYAADLGYERVVKALLAHDDVRANAADTRGQTALHLATARNRLAVVFVLLAHSGTDAAAKTNKGFTALHWAAQLGHTNIARALLAADDNLVNQQTNRQRTALHYASELGQRAIVNLLLQQDGVNLDYVDDNSDTALHYAAAHNRLAIAESLLEAGASTGVANKQGKTARTLAHDKGYTQMVQLIDRYRN